MTERCSWSGAPVLVTGGASFIGSHLVDALVALGARVRVVDDLSSGVLENIGAHVRAGAVAFTQADLSDRSVAARAVDGVRVVFHLAATHGGRGYLERHPSACATNLVLDGVVFAASAAAGVERVVYASSACVYPVDLQADPFGTCDLSEAQVGPPFNADGVYGWAKLMGEMALRAYVADGRLKAVSCRYFTVYGERGLESHALHAMIARAFIGQDPFAVWGNGQQIRNWTHVSDIVAGTLLAAERIDDGSAVNLGTSERTRVIDAARAVLACTGHRAAIALQPDMPTGPLNRVADHRLATARLGWEPRVAFVEGLRRTVDWYYHSKDRAQVADSLETKLTER